MQRLPMKRRPWNTKDHHINSAANDDNGANNNVVVIINDNGTEYYAPARCHCGRHNPCRHHDNSREEDGIAEARRG